MQPVSRYSMLAALTAMTLATACSSGTKFSGGGADASKQPPPQALDAQSLSNTQEKEEKSMKIAFDIQGDASVVNFGDDEVTVRPVSILFLLDTTGSMQDAIDTVKNNIQAFVTKLVAKDFELKFGVVPFRDELQSELPLTNNVAQFQQFMAGVSAGGGLDRAEASLMAMTHGVKRMFEQDPSDSAKVVMLITDAYGHHGEKDAQNRHLCGLQSVIDATASLSALQRDQLKFFYSSKEEMTNGCSGFRSGHQQYTSLFESILTEVDAEKRGGSIPFPFTAESLVEDFGEAIEKVVDGERLTCLTRKAKLFDLEDPEKVYWQWEAKDDQDVISRVDDSNRILLDLSLSTGAVDRTKEDKVGLTVQRCCKSSEAVSSGAAECAIEDEVEVEEFSLEDVAP